jgi:exopolyphosphatase/guanosine-5'-triphosphate,3'-diphosphate pyrophosphatase
MNSIAILDLGTNTFHLLIAEISGQRPEIIFQETLAVRLGEGGMRDGMINVSAFERGLSALRQFKRSIDQHKAVQVKAIATSALRSASNGAEFIRYVLAETGINIEIIDGNREAELICSGVRAAINMKDQNSLIMDIGGGSVEFIICNQDQIFWKKSFDIGAARLMDQFHRSDPISQSDINELQSFLNSVLNDLNIQLDIYKPIQFIGSAGAFETFAGMIDPAFSILFEKPEFNFELNQFEKIAKFIIGSSHDERAMTAAIPAVRVDMIVVATLLTRYILNIYNFKALKLSTYSLKEGVLFEIKNQLKS